ncbi:MAG: CPBP family intramembrane glutamic endopeptidase [Chitinophagales bacterium]
MENKQRNIGPYLNYLKKLAIGLVAVIAAVAFTELILGRLIGLSAMPETSRNIINTLADITMAMLAYIITFRTLEKRDIKELAISNFAHNAGFGFGIGLFLQGFPILILVLLGGYSVIQTNPVSSLLPSFATALMAGFVAELLIRGVFFRLTEEVFGTTIALIISVMLFAVIHSFGKNASFLSVSATSIVAGILLPATFIYSRSLWLPIFIHFARDWAEPGIFGGINPGNSITESWLTSQIKGSSILTGGQMGPQNSIQSLILCAILAFLFLWMGKKKKHFINPIWSK